MTMYTEKLKYSTLYLAIGDDMIDDMIDKKSQLDQLIRKIRNHMHQVLSVCLIPCLNIYIPVPNQDYDER